MRTCAAKVQLPSEYRISHSSQSTYFDAVALVESLIKQFNYRVKGTEKSWLLENAESILQVRAALLSEDERLERHMDGRMCLPFRRYKRDTDEGKAA